MFQPQKVFQAFLGIQTFEFLIKVVGGIGAIIFLVNVCARSYGMKSFSHPNCRSKHWIIVAILGIALMMTGAIVLAAFTWSKRAISIFDRIANSTIPQKIHRRLNGKA